MNSDELDKKIAEIAAKYQSAIRKASGQSEFDNAESSLTHWQSDLFDDLVADRERLKVESTAKDSAIKHAEWAINRHKARIAELEAELKAAQHIGKILYREVENHLPDAGQKVEPLGLGDYDEVYLRYYPSNPNLMAEGKESGWQIHGDRVQWFIWGPTGRQEFPSYVTPEAALIAVNAARGCKPPLELLTASTPVGSKVQALDRVMFPLQLEYLLEWRDAEDGAWRVSYEHDAIKPGHNGTKWQMTIPADRFHQFRVIAGPEEGGK